MARSNARLVYSTAGGEVCPTCGWPKSNCACSRRTSTPAAPAPARLVAKLRLETKGRGGKAVSVVYDLPRNDALLRDLCRDLKKACGTGGTVHEDTIELQGDLRDRIRAALVKQGYTVKG